MCLACLIQEKSTFSSIERLCKISLDKYERFVSLPTHNLSIECQLVPFNKMVKTIILYDSEMWGFRKNIQCLEKVQLTCCKLLFISAACTSCRLCLFQQYVLHAGFCLFH
jgi:hypothetical protein